MGSDPVARNIDAAADPDALVLQYVVEKALQCGDSSWSADQAAVQSDRQHLRCVISVRITFPIQGIERRLQVIEELAGAVETLRGGKPHVVAIERVGYYQVRNAAPLGAGAYRDLG